MPRVQDGHELLLDHDRALDVGLRRQVEHQRPGRSRSCAARRRPARGPRCATSKATSGCALRNSHDHTRQELRRQRLAGHQAHAAAPQALQLLDFRAHPLQVGGAAADVAHEEFARRRQPHAARQALEDRRAELVLDVLDAAIHGGGCHVQPLGRLADRARAGHFVDVAQKTQMVHAAGSCNASCLR